MKYTNNHPNMIKEYKRLNGSQSTKNFDNVSFINPKKTVSINLYANDEEDQRKSIECSSSYNDIIAEVFRNRQNSSKFTTMKNQNTFENSKRSLNSTMQKEIKNFGTRKRTMENTNNLANLSKQLKRTEKTLETVSKKQSKQMSSIHDKIQVLKSQLNTHKKTDSYTHLNRTPKTPNAQTRFKSKNMSKYLQNKSRNSQTDLKVSKTQERASSKRAYKPYSTMMKSLSKVVLNHSSSNNRRTQHQRIPKYIEKAYNEAIRSIDSESSRRNYDSQVISDQSDKTTQKNAKKELDSSNIISMSEEHEDYDRSSPNPMDTLFQSREHLMHIQEEQEYTTNEKPTYPANSSCDCDTDEDVKYQSSSSSAHGYYTGH